MWYLSMALLAGDHCMSCHNFDFDRSTKEDGHNFAGRSWVSQRKLDHHIVAGLLMVKLVAGFWIRQSSLQKKTNSMTSLRC